MNNTRGSSHINKYPTSPSSPEHPNFSSFHKHRRRPEPGLYHNHTSRDNSTTGHHASWRRCAPGVLPTPFVAATLTCTYCQLKISIPTWSRPHIESLVADHDETDFDEQGPSHTRAHRLHDRVWSCSLRCPPCLLAQKPLLQGCCLWGWSLQSMFGRLPAS